MGKTILKVKYEDGIIEVIEKEALDQLSADMKNALSCALSQYMATYLVEHFTCPELALCSLDTLYFAQLGLIKDKLEDCKSIQLHFMTTDLLKAIRDSISDEIMQYLEEVQQDEMHD